MAKTIVVFGSTGVQGSSLIKALAGHNTPIITYHIVALTRNPSSSASKRLAALPGVEVVQVAENNMDEPAAVFAKLGRAVHGVFSVQGYVDDKAMIRQGKAVADAAVAAGAKHLVYSSTEAGDYSGMPSYATKFVVEDHIRTLPIGHTFLRPVQFMDNYLPSAPFFFRMGRTVTLRYTFYHHPERKHQLISARDIGRAGAKAFAEGPDWMAGVVPLAADAVCVRDIERIYKEVYGEPIALVNGLLARTIKTFVPIVRGMVHFFDDVGYRVDIPAVEKELPGMLKLREFFELDKAGKL
ncbi:hypothetical protein Q5752_003984 [Cryptotrichosporon argae]